MTSQTHSLVSAMAAFSGQAAALDTERQMALPVNRADPVSATPASM